MIRLRSPLFVYMRPRQDEVTVYSSTPNPTYPWWISLFLFWSLNCRTRPLFVSISACWRTRYLLFLLCPLSVLQVLLLLPYNVVFFGCLGGAITVAGVPSIFQIKKNTPSLNVHIPIATYITQCLARDGTNGDDIHIHNKDTKMP